MNRLALLALLSSLAGCPAGTATGSAVVTTGPTTPARPDPGYRPAPSTWDSTGWTLLGSQTVNGRTDRDTIVVNQRARFDKLTLVVENSDLELLDLDIEFANGQRWSPRIGYRFREGQRSRTIDLPGDDRHIARITLLYRNTPGGGAARASIYGKDTRNASAYQPAPATPAPYQPAPSTPSPAPYQPAPSQPPPPPAYQPAPSAPAWDATGWTLLGTQTVDGRRDRDTFAVGKKYGRLDRITIVVKDSDLDMQDFVVTFENGQKFEPKIKHVFRENQRTRSIDLPGNDRFIKQINVQYKNLPGGGKARVEIYGKDTRTTGGPQPSPSPSPKPNWDASGWTLLGAQAVNGRRDRDVYQVGKKPGRLDVITLVVKDSDLEIDDLIITFENGEKWEPKLKHSFREGSRTRQIDLPSADRFIKTIEVRYKNTPGGGNARLEIYGRDTKQGRDPKKGR